MVPVFFSITYSPSVMWSGPADDGEEDPGFDTLPRWERLLFTAILVVIAAGTLAGLIVFYVPIK